MLIETIVYYKKSISLLLEETKCFDEVYISFNL